MRDILGNELSAGMNVVFADYTDDGESTRLHLYEIVQLHPDDDMVVGMRLTGRLQDIGDEYYLCEASLRVLVIGEDKQLYVAAQYYDSSQIN